MLRVIWSLIFHEKVCTLNGKKELNMATDGDIEASINEIMSFVSQKAPTLAPAIFLKHQVPSSVADLCSTAQQRALLESKWSQRNSVGVVFVTAVDYKRKMIFLNEIRAVNSELDAKLGSLESMMKMFVEGGEEEVSVTTARFLEANGYSGEKKTEKYIIQQVYNAAYAAKVLLSNAPMRLAINLKKKKQIYSLPLTEDIDALKVIESITLSEFGNEKKATFGKRKLATEDSEDDSGKEEEDDDDDDDDNSNHHDKLRATAKSGNGKKRRKKKRGGGK